MKLVVGLGNPGKRYQGTRHNVGYAVLAELGRRFGTGAPKAKFHGEVLDADLEGVRALLLSPTTYMNRSGLSVQAARAFYKIPEDDILVICDDLNLPVAKLRTRRGGSSGGQKGLEDIIRRLGTDQFPRLRIGIGGPAVPSEAVGHVLGRMSPEERQRIEQAVQNGADAVVVWAHDGIDACMNRYN